MAGESDYSAEPANVMDNTAMALALLGPNHRGNVTFEAIDENAASEPRTSQDSLPRGNSTEPQPTSPNPNVKFAETDDIKFSEWYKTEAGSKPGSGAFKRLSQDGARTPELGSSLR